MISKEEEKLVLRTPNNDCPACKEKRRHTEKETKQFHPQAGQGFCNDHRLAGG